MTAQYSTIASMTFSTSLQERIAACYVSQEGATQDPRAWSASNIWKLAAQPGWAEAWESAKLSTPWEPDPGVNPNVITDGMILSAVQNLLGVTQADPDPSTADSSTDTSVASEPTP